MTSRLSLHLFGPFEARLGDTPLPRLRTRKAQWLLALLALRPRAEVARAWLAGTLWPDSPEPAALANLRSVLQDLRRALGPEACRLRSPTTRTLTLDLTGAWLDVREFDAAIRAGDFASLEQAVALYRGPLLEDCHAEWVFDERRAREEAYLAALEALAEQALATNNPAGAERWLRRVVAVDPLREGAQRKLMEALAAGGSYAAALVGYRDLRQRLYRELNATPDGQTTALYEQLREETRQRAPDRAGDRVTASPFGGRTDPLMTGGPPSFTWSIPAAGGAVPLDSAFYVVRPADALFHAALARRESIVLVKGARQMGKTSLLARGLHAVRKTGARVIRTDLQLLDAADFESVDRLLRALAAWVADELELETNLDQMWQSHLGASVNLTRFLRRQVLREVTAPVVWGLDEVDRLFSCDFGSQVFGMFRAWHNDRVLDPAGPWSRLTLAMAYATEHHLFVSDLNQSPFNVGARLFLEDFTTEQVADLNRRFGSPLRGETEIARLVYLVGGQPYLVHSGLRHLAASGGGMERLEAEAERNEGPFGDHLRRLLVSLKRDPDLCEVVRMVLRGEPCPTEEFFYRLRSAGVLSGDSILDARPRCRLYAAYLSRFLE